MAVGDPMAPPQTEYYLLHCPLCDFTQWLDLDQYHDWRRHLKRRCPRCDMGLWTCVGTRRGPKKER